MGSTAFERGGEMDEPAVLLLASNVRIQSIVFRS